METDPASGTVRAFIAVSLPPAIRDALAVLQEDLKPLTRHVRWVDPGNIHLTLAFLGDIATDVIPIVSATLDEAVQSFPPFSLTVGSPGFFGSPRSPRVVWVGFSEPQAPLLALQAAVDSAVRSLGLALDNKPFHPHLTLGRLRHPRDPDSLVKAIVSKKDATFGVFRVDEIRLMKSDLTPDGPIYAELHASPFGSSGRPRAGG